MVSESLGGTRGLCTPHALSAEGLVVAPQRLSRTWKPKAKVWNLHSTAGSQPSGRKLTLVSESVSEEEAVGGSLGKFFQDLLAQHTRGGHTDRQGSGEARGAFILRLQGDISHRQPDLPLLQKQTAQLRDIVKTKNLTATLTSK